MDPNGSHAMTADTPPEFTLLFEKGDPQNTTTAVIDNLMSFINLPERFS
jgi:hypothetical protein